MVTSLMSSSNSCSVGFMPMALMAYPNSLVVMVPDPSSSNSLKASRSSATYRNCSILIYYPFSLYILI